MDQVALLGAGWEGEVGKWENKLGIRQQATATHIPESFQNKRAPNTFGTTLVIDS